jgi:mycobactin lysine-N-oxygenase
VADSTNVRVDVAIVGAGPKAAALAAKGHVFNELGYGPLRIAIIEQREIAASWVGRHGFTSGIEELGTRPEKDVGFPYQSTSCFGAAGRQIDNMMVRFSWQNYLIDIGEFRRWVDIGVPYPTHREFAAYLVWVLSSTLNGVTVRRAKVVSIQLHPEGWLLSCVTANGEKENVLAERGIVLTGPSVARSLPFAKEVAHRIANPAMKVAELRALPLSSGGRVCIVGRGESAAALALFLIREFGEDLRLTFVAPSLPYSRAESFLENSVYSDPQIVAWHRLTEPMRQEFIRRTDRGVMSPGALAKLSRHRRLSFIVGRVRYIQVGACGLARVVIDQSDEVIRQDFDIVANCTGGCPIAGLLSLLGDDSQALLEKHIGIALNDELSVIRGLDATLALRGFTPHIHLPALAGLVYGPGFANLSCLGRLSDLIFSGYVSLPFADGMRTESPVTVDEPPYSEEAHTQV